VTGHGPATDRDLAYWATLTLGDARTALAAAGDRLARTAQDGRTYWYAADQEPPRDALEPEGHLLQMLDETYRGFQDSRWVLDAQGVVPRGREATVGMALHDAQLVAGMRRTVTERRVSFELLPHPSWVPEALAALQDAARRYGAFLGREAQLRVAPA
jgi:hypothetical protein